MGVFLLSWAWPVYFADSFPGLGLGAVVNFKTADRSSKWLSRPGRAYAGF
jgi:hypothetical protein